MHVKPKISPEFVQEKYIELLESANMLSQQKQRSLTIKNSSIFIGIMSLGVLLFVLVQNISNRTADVFEKQLTAVAYNEQDVLIETEAGIFYKIDQNIAKRWLSTDNQVIAMNKDKLIFSATTSMPSQQDKTYTLWVPKHKKYELELIDGTQIFLNENSKIQFATTRVTSGTNAILEGEAFFEVAHNPDVPFSIKASALDIAVFGTTFNVSNYQQNAVTSVALLTGSVQVSGLSKDKTFITPGQQATLNRLDGQLRISAADFSKTLVWRTDQLHFNNETLQSITKKLEKWYDINFFIDGLELQNRCFTGSFTREDGMTHFLQMLDYTEGIQYKIDDKKITLYR